jgi:nucleotide-binding universal stress UspA family protein
MKRIRRILHPTDFSGASRAALDRALALSRDSSAELVIARARKARVRVRGVIVEGSAHERIVRAAKRLRIDLIVMGTHGRSGLARLFVGSVASRVVSTSPCPVMTVRPR